MEFDQFAATLKPFTKLYLISGLAVSVLGFLGIVGPAKLVHIVPDNLHHVN